MTQVFEVSSEANENNTSSNCT